MVPLLLMVRNKPDCLFLIRTTPIAGASILHRAAKRGEESQASSVRKQGYVHRYIENIYFKSVIIL